MFIFISCIARDNILWQKTIDIPNQTNSHANILTGNKQNSDYVCGSCGTLLSTSLMLRKVYNGVSQLPQA